MRQGRAKATFNKLQVLAVLLLTTFLAPSTGDEACSWEQPGQGSTAGQIIDITLGLGPDTLVFSSDSGLGNFRTLKLSMDDGEMANISELKDFDVHTGTHLDGPGHFVNVAYKTGKGVEALDLYTLNGPALVVDLPHDQNITAEAMEQLHLPPGIRRLIFKTLNTAKDLMHKTAFEPSYTGMTADGAQWLVDHTEVRLVGIDYMSIALFADLAGAHDVLLPKGIIPVEGLVLNDVSPGLYNMHCLPLKLIGSDGAPARCILVT